MMERINIFNYEEFYLDFLEGNLNTADSARFFAFLEANPQLRLENENLPILEKSAIDLDTSFKLNLKQNEAYHIDFHSDTITPENQESFMIADAERILSPKKQLELDEYIGQNHALIHLRNMYASLHLKPDKKLVFKEKSSLKKKKTIPLWPFISIAASCAFLLLIWNPSSRLKSEKNISKIEVNDTIQQTKRSEKAIQKNKTKNQQKDSLPSEEFKANYLKDNAEQNIPLISSDKKLFAQENVAVQKSSQKFDEIYLLKLIPSKEIRYQASDLALVERNNSVEQPTLSTLSNQDFSADYAMLSFDEMNNPIRPITNKLSAVVNQEVDFRAAKATEKRSGGFYLKLGKIEISHRNF
jgi:hypothetical protein